MNHRPRQSRWQAILLAAGGLLAALAASFASDAAGNVSPAQAAGMLAGGALALGGGILAFKPAGDPRPAPRYVVETALAGVEALGELVGGPRAGLWTMIPVLLLAALLRLHHLTFQSFWLDELMTWWRSSYLDLPTVLRSVESDVWPPGYSLWAYGLIHTLGASDFILRFFPALAGVLSSASIYALGRRLALPNPAQPGKRGLGGHLAGLFGALLISVLEISIYYSQEARPYAGLILFSILSTYFWLRVIDGVGGDPGSATPGGTRQRRVPTSFTLAVAGYVLTALLAIYWNYYGLVLVGLQAVGAGLRLVGRPRTWLKIIGMYAAVGVGCLPWLGQTLADLGRDVYLPTRPGGYLDELMAYFRFLFNLEQGYVLAAIGVVAAALVADAVRGARGRPARWPSRTPQSGGSGGWATWVVLLGWLLLPFTLTYARSLVSVSTFLHRYLLISLPAAALLPALAMARLPIRRWMQAGLMLLAALVLLNNLVRHWDYYTRPTKAQFRDAVEMVDRADPGLGGKSVIVGYTGYQGTLPLFDFYFAQARSDRRAQVEAGFGKDIGAVRQEVARTEAHFVWVIAAQNKPADSFGEAMGRAFTLVEHREFNEADVWLYAVR